MLIKIQPDATVCRYLFTAKSLYMFRVSQHPSSGVLKTVTASSGTGHNTGTATSLQRGLIRPRWREVVNSELHRTCTPGVPKSLERQIHRINHAVWITVKSVVVRDFDLSSSHVFRNIVSTFSDWYRSIEMRPCGRRVISRPSAAAKQTLPS
jgi:hypothetical protein